MSCLLTLWPFRNLGSLCPPKVVEKSAVGKRRTVQRMPPSPLLYFATLGDEIASHAEPVTPAADSHVP